MRRAFIALAGILAIAAAARAQTISYVASIKPNNSAGARTLIEYSPGGRLSATAITVRTLIRLAWRLQDYQVAGEPGWFAVKRYDIAAKADGNPAPQQQFLIRALFKDRCGLVVHNEVRQLPGFALAPARNDGQLGPGLHKSDFDCAAYFASSHPLPTPGQTPTCGARINMGSLSAKSIPMTQLVTILAPLVGRFVADKTGLIGGFDVDLTWAPDQPAPRGDVAADAPGPSIFTALQEQLGLKLASEKAPVEVLVIDHAEEPRPE